MAQANRKRKYKPKPRSTCDFVFRNDFHHTSYTMRTRYYKPITPDQMRMCRKTLCGVTDCKSGGKLGERGPQDAVIVVGWDLTGREVVTLEPLRGSFMQR